MDKIAVTIFTLCRVEVVLSICEECCKMPSKKPVQPLKARRLAGKEWRLSMDRDSKEFLHVCQDRLLKPIAGFAGYNSEMRELAAVISRVRTLVPSLMPTHLELMYNRLWHFRQLPA